MTNTKRLKSAKLTKKQGQVLAEALLRRGLLLRRRAEELGAADRAARAAACLAEAELRAAASRLLCRYPGPGEDQFAELARRAYQDVSARVDLGSTTRLRMEEGEFAFLTFRSPDVRGAYGRAPGKRGGR